MVVYWGLIDRKSFHVSCILYSILVDLNNAVVWIALIHPAISYASTPIFRAFLDWSMHDSSKWYHRFPRIPQFS